MKIQTKENMIQSHGVLFMLELSTDPQVYNQVLTWLKLQSIQAVLIGVSFIYMSCSNKIFKDKESFVRILFIALSIWFLQQGAFTTLKILTVPELAVEDYLTR